MQIARESIERYVGLAYRPGVFDCADLVALVRRELFGREIQLPQDRARPIRARDMARQIEHLQDDVARRNLDPDGPADGDGVLLTVGELPLHIGMCFWIGPEVWILHNDPNLKQSVLTRWRDMWRLGFKIDGCWSWI